MQFWRMKHGNVFDFPSNSSQALMVAFSASTWCMSSPKWHGNAAPGLDWKLRSEMQISSNSLHGSEVSNCSKNSHMLQVFSQGEVLQRYVQQSRCHTCIGKSVLIGKPCTHTLASRWSAPCFSGRVILFWIHFSFAIYDCLDVFFHRGFVFVFTTPWIRAACEECMHIF